MNLAMYNIPSNLKNSLHKTWQTLLLFLKPLQIQTLRRKTWGDMAYYIPPTEKVGGHDPVFPTRLRPCNQSWLWSRLHTTLAQIARIAPKWIYTVLDIFSPFTIFEQLALALQKQSCPEIFHCIEYTFYIQDFWATLCLPWKTELPRNFSLYWIYILHSGF